MNLKRLFSLFAPKLVEKYKAEAFFFFKKKNSEPQYNQSRKINAPIINHWPIRLRIFLQKKHSFLDPRMKQPEQKLKYSFIYI